jgi:DNA-binding MarR family transcriptional regulator
MAASARNVKDEMAAVASEVCTDREFVDLAVGHEAKGFKSIVEDAAEQLSMSRATAARYLQRLVAAGLVKSSGGLYWASAGGQEA